ncbi:4'-phosphopantetheinyl transferase family protein [Candidatus Odyssella acanthamoebae]|uniref:4'-phosphopantetheinyl transferase family protein n=1 Tax=Candidatus Odyssella acanthamoebae TaxID=91604 RepID=UPI00068B4074|nr:4'-phosphopantetheinyl transferase superfamily protein [Candidatus Paracaedibacter acanthamoebae]
MNNNLLAFTYKTPLTLQHGNVEYVAGFCVSKLSLEELNANYSDFLHVEEEKYFMSLRYPKRQHSYLLGRYCAKQSLILYIQNNQPTTLWIKNGVFQQPIVYSSFPTDAQVSISHTDTFGAALAFSEAHPMGIDVEHICATKAATIKSQLTLAEQQKIISFSDDSPLFLTLFWTVKEALSKVIKCGFTIPSKLLEIGDIQLKENYVESKFKNFQQYQALSFSVANYVCSIVYPKNSVLTSNLSAIKTAMTELPMPQPEYDLTSNKPTISNSA